MKIDDLIAPALASLQKNSGTSKESLPGLFILQVDRTSAFEAVVYNPVACLILQGAKETHIGDQVQKLQAGDALVVSHDLPVQSKITQASEEAPYLALVLSLDISTLRSLYEQVGTHVGRVPKARSLLSGPAEPDLLDPVARYLALADDPVGADVLGPAILREIHFRLLMSPLGGMLRRLLSVDSHASRISQAILKIRAGFRQTLMVNDLARSVGMSPSSFHGHFKLVTGTTPLRYQKDLRMIAARDLLRGGRHNVSAASFEVGYESPTHFSRDYQRKFGMSPSKAAQAVSQHA